MFDVDIEKIDNEPLSKHCTFRIGGNCKSLYFVYSENAMMKVCKFCKQNKIKYKIIGYGANLLFDDKGYNGAIIVNRTNKIKFNGTNVYVESGLPIVSLINKCRSNGLGGIENLSGIPSTVGGAVVNNLGAFDTSFSDFVEYVVCYKKNNLNNKLFLSKNDCMFEYRNSVFKNQQYVIIGVSLKLYHKNSNLIEDNIARAIAKKTATQPLGLPSAGSVFKRCEIIPAKIIDELGLKGTKIGDAEISTKHAGFIVNTGNATSEDIKKLIKLTKNKVKKATNIDLQTEIEIVKF